MVVIGTYVVLDKDMPQMDKLKETKLEVPLRIYASDSQLMKEFGGQRRVPVTYENIPPIVVNAFLAAEDARFFEHPGVDYRGMARAIKHSITTNARAQGGSTITMQLARNLFLSNERSYTRKVREIFISFKMEKRLTKQEIMALYLNKIFLGHQSYGVGAAAKTYYGKTLDELSIAEVATIAGLPKAPSTINPITNPKRSVDRRSYVLRRLHELKFIDDTQLAEAKAAPVTAKIHKREIQLEADFISEMARAEMVKRYGQDAYTGGFKVFTTVQPKLQNAANSSVRSALEAYEVRHGFRGPEGNIDTSMPETSWDKALKTYSTIGDLRAAIVIGMDSESVSLYTGGDEDKYASIKFEDIKWARKHINVNKLGPELTSPADILRTGDVVRIKQVEGIWQLAQKPKIEGSLVAMNPDTGAIVALVGGYNFQSSEFNRATQAYRQSGSSIKPFMYAAALARGMTPASILQDNNIMIYDSQLETYWRPENYNRRPSGPVRLRHALVKSLNLASIKLVNQIRIRYAMRFATRFGFPLDRLPRNLSLALGSNSVTPLELARGFSIFANGGYRVSPYFIQRIEDMDGNVVYEAKNPTVDEAALRELNRIDDEALRLALAEEDAERIVSVEGNEAAAATASTAVPTNPTAAQTQAIPEREARSADERSSDTTASIEDEERAKPAPRVLSKQIAYQMTSMLRDVVREGTAKRAKVLNRNDLGGKTGTTNDQKDAWFTGFGGNIVATVWVGYNNPTKMGARESGGRAALPMWIDFMKVALEGEPERRFPMPQGIASVRINPESGLRTSPSNPDAITETFRVTHIPERDDYEEPIDYPEDEPEPVNSNPRSDPDAAFNPDVDGPAAGDTGSTGTEPTPTQPPVRREPVDYGGDDGRDVFD